MIALIGSLFAPCRLRYVVVRGRASDRLANEKETKAMNFSYSTVRRSVVSAFAASALGAAIAATIAAPVASADSAPCTAAELSSTVSAVTAAAGQYLDSHPDVNDAITAAGAQTPEQAQANLRSYFVSHPQQYNDLRAIARPLADLRTSCNTNVTGAQVAALLQAFTS